MSSSIQRLFAFHFNSLDRSTCTRKFLSTLVPMKTTAAVAALVVGASALPYVRRQANHGNGSAPVTNPAVWRSLRGKIKHVVYLMEE